MVKIPESCQMNKQRIDEISSRFDKIEAKMDMIMNATIQNTSEVKAYKEVLGDFKRDYCDKVKDLEDGYKLQEIKINSLNNWKAYVVGIATAISLIASFIFTYLKI